MAFVGAQGPGNPSGCRRPKALDMNAAGGFPWRAPVPIRERLLQTILARIPFRRPTPLPLPRSSGSAPQNTVIPSARPAEIPRWKSRSRPRIRRPAGQCAVLAPPAATPEPPAGAGSAGEGRPARSACRRGARSPRMGTDTPDLRCRILLGGAHGLAESADRAATWASTMRRRRRVGQTARGAPKRRLILWSTG